jgi:hypothetical protein
VVRIWVLAAVVVGCAAPRVDVTRSFTFHNLWIMDADEIWDAAVAAAADEHRPMAVDRTRGAIVVGPEPAGAIDVFYVVVIHWNETWYWRARRSTRLAVDVTPVAYEGRTNLLPERVPSAARDHADDLLWAIRKHAYDSGAAQ